MVRQKKFWFIGISVVIGIIIMFSIFGGGSVKNTQDYKNDLVLASTFTGQLVDQAGNPVPDVLIARDLRWVWNDKTFHQEVVTSVDGSFSFEPMVVYSFWAGLMPHQPRIEQHITTTVGGQTKDLFAVTKTSYEMNAELESRTMLRDHLNMICDIDDESNTDNNKQFRGVCVERPVDAE